MIKFYFLQTLDANFFLGKVNFSGSGNTFWLYRAPYSKSVTRARKVDLA